MSSSTSSSEQAARTAKWTGFTGAFRGAAVLIATARRSRTALADGQVDGLAWRDPNLFFDHSRYHQPIARLVEADIVEAIRKLD